MKIVALDPGKVNFAAAAIDGRSVLETRYLTPIASLKWESFPSAVKLFGENYLKYITEIEPDCVIAERFMSRPGGGVKKGAVGEYVNVQLGVISTVNYLKGIPTHLVTSAQWKTTLNNRYGKVPENKGFRHHFPHLSDHEADALAIAVYVLEQEYPEERGKLLKHIRRLRKYPFAGKLPDAKEEADD